MMSKKIKAASLVEYGLLSGLISVFSISAVYSLGSTFRGEAEEYADIISVAGNFQGHVRNGSFEAGIGRDGHTGLPWRATKDGARGRSGSLLG